MEQNKEPNDGIRDNNKSKNTRREVIRRLIANEHISTQVELSRRLEEEGFQVTQATVSRDIRELRLVKISDGNGSYHYELGKPVEKYHASSKFYSMFQSSVTGVDFAQNLVVIHTYTGMAQAVCATMDRVEWPGVLGTIAGDDTVLVITKTEETAKELVQTLQEI
ncbi:MAG: arginine repressor [Clostridiales bacterium]|nr:arginine repressor [Clostridiales bacterium]